MNYSHGPVIIRPNKKIVCFLLHAEKNRVGKVGSQKKLFWEIILYLGSVFFPCQMEKYDNQSSFFNLIRQPYSTLYGTSDVPGRVFV